MGDREKVLEQCREPLRPLAEWLWDALAASEYRSRLAVAQRAGHAKTLVYEAFGGQRLIGLDQARDLAQAMGRDPAAVEPIWHDAKRAVTASFPTSVTGGSSPRLGRPIGDCDPYALEVHRAIEASDRGRMDDLPTYVERAHDRRLRDLTDEVLEGASRMITLVGGSSTGKTRTCWELARSVETRQPGRWRLWHPYDPDRPEAVTAALQQAGPFTIVWLNEAQLYLGPPDARLGERVAAGLRALLQDPMRGPVLILATLWPEHWAVLTKRPEIRSRTAAVVLDEHAQARELLDGTDIDIPASFTDTDRAALRDNADERLRQAFYQAEGGRIAQFLAGAPLLLGRFRKAPPAARAIVEAAIDARRLGHPSALPYALLEQAAEGYLDDLDWDQLDADWLVNALAYVAEPCNGVRGLLSRIRPRSGNSPGLSEPLFRLADYIEQNGSLERQYVFPPESLWVSLSATAEDPAVLETFASQALIRGRRQTAIWLYQQAIDRGGKGGMLALARLRTDAHFLAPDSELNNPEYDPEMEDPSRGFGLGEKADIWRQAVARNNADAMLELAEHYRAVDDPSTAEALLRRAAALGRTPPEPLHIDFGPPADSPDEGVSFMPAEDPGSAVELGLPHGVDGGEESFLQRANRGEIDAIGALGVYLRKSHDPEARTLLESLARRGHLAAAQVLAGHYYFDDGNASQAEEVLLPFAVGGDLDALNDLSTLRVIIGDIRGGEELAVRAVNSGGGPNAVQLLVYARYVAGRRLEAICLRRFGMTIDGNPAPGLDFGPYGGLVTEPA